MEHSKTFTVFELNDGSAIVEELEKDNEFYKANRVLVKNAPAMYYVLTQLTNDKVMITNATLRAYYLNLMKSIDLEYKDQEFTPSIMYDEQSAKELRLARERPVQFTPEFDSLASNEIRERTQEIIDETEKSISDRLHEGAKKLEIQKPRKLRRFE